MENKYVIVTGEMRSGTTFLANLLNSQPGFHVACDFVKSPFFESRKLRKNDLTSNLTEREVNVLRSNLVAESALLGYGDRWLKKSEFRNVIALVKEAFDHLAPEAEIKGSKITCLSFDEIVQILESDIKVLYIVRDPRDVSISSKNRFSYFNFFKQLEDYRRSISRILKLKHPNFILIRFEDLISKNKATLDSVAELLNRERIITDLESLKVRKAGSFNDNSSFNDINELFDRKAIFRWKEKEADLEIKFTSVFLKDLIDELDYDRLAVKEAEIRQLWNSYNNQKMRKKIRSVIKSFLP